LPARTSFLWSGRIFCACGRPLKIHEDYRSKRSYARCNSTKRHGRDDTRNIPLRILEPWILDTLERTIPGEAIQRHYLQAVRNSQEAIERSHRDGCERLRKEIDEKEELYNRSWRRDLTQGISGARLAEFRQEQEAEIESLKTELFELERSRPTKLEINEKAVEAMPDMLALIRSRSPFKPRDLYERRVAAAIKMLTPSIKIGFEGGNHYTLSLTMRPLAVAAANFKADNLNDLETTTVELKYNGEYGFAMPFRYSAKTDLQAEHQKMAKAGKFALTDKQWQKLQPHCPPHLDKTIDQRKTVDALIFTLAAEISFMYAPPFFGDRPDVYAAMRRFIWGGGIEAIQRCFADDEFIRRLNFSRWKGIRRSPLVQEPVRDDRLMDWKPFRLTDPEWSEIAHLVPDSAINSLGKKVIEKRDLVDAIVVKVRSGTSWPTIPSELGDDRVIFRAILRLVRCGAWDRILFALLNKFPAKYEPFIWPDYVGRKRSAGSWRWKKENLDPRLAAIKRDKAVA
jgi:transposase